MELEPQDVASLTDALNSAVRAIDKFNGGGNTTNAANINLNAGGIGIWIAVTCCAVMFVLGVSMAVLDGLAYTSTQQRLDRMQDYLNAIYMQAPQLKPKETTK